MQTVITFNKTGYDPFLDFIKSFAILSVLLGHTFPYLDQTGYSLWYGMQVPLFVLVQAFHVFKKNTYKLNLLQLFKRIFIPFILVEVVIVFVLLVNGGNFNQLNREILNGGGIGPGSYYPWLYLQIAIILPFVKPLFNKGSRIKLAAISIAVCETLEILSSLTGLPDSVHRLLAIRYFFLIYLGWIWVKNGIVLNTKTIIFSLLSMGTIIYFEYFYTPCEPWFYDTAWRTHRWPCYFYVSTLLCVILYWIYNKTKGVLLVGKMTKILAKCSYEIFLVQMIAVSLMPQMSFIHNDYVCLVVRMILIWTFSIVGGYFFNLTYNSLLNRKK